MKLNLILWAALPGLLSTGCIYSHRQPAVVYYTPPPVQVVTPQVMAPTSDRPEVRVYPPPTGVTTPTAPAPPGVAESDVAVADSVSQLLKGDSGMISASRNVMATVDGGVVTLRGTVVADHDRDEIVQRVSQLPGVKRVRDELGVENR